MRSANEINSPDVESYHSWSSNGQWVIFSSRREDGSYTRFYMAHFDKETASFSKPFVLPQKNPMFNKEFLKSFNIPEFMVRPVDFDAKDLPKYLKKDAKTVVYRE